MVWAFILELSVRRSSWALKDEVVVDVVLNVLVTRPNRVIEGAR